MYARVITAEAGPDGFDSLVRLAEQQLPGAWQQPGFEGFYLLADDATGRLMNISLWQTREHMEAVAQGTAAGVHEESVDATGLTTPHLETYEVKLHS